MKKLPNLIINSGDPAGIGLDLCVMLAFKKFMANITIIGNKDAILSRAKQQKKNISRSIFVFPTYIQGEVIVQEFARCCCVAYNATTDTENRYGSQQ